MKQIQSEAYCIYLRKSRKDMEAEARGEGETLRRHEKALFDLSKKLRIHIPKDNIYREIVSGETIEARPEMQRLLRDVEQGKWAGVLVMEVERLARGDTSDQGTVAKAFKFSSTKIITPAKTYDPDNEYDEEYFEFSLFMSRREFKTINRRIQRGRIASAKEGKFLSSVAPYGYKKVKIKNDKGYTLEPDTEHAPIVKMIYDLYVQGDLQPDGSYLKFGATRIADRLNELGYKPIKNNVWTKSSITDILKNPVYTGKIRWSYKREKKSYENGQLHKTRTKTSGDYILAEGLHEPIIDLNIFNTAQQLMATRGHASIPGHKIMQNPLSGIIYCSKCGQMMTRLAKNNKTPYDTIKCPNTKCDNISSPLYLVEEVLIHSLNKWHNDYKVKWEQKKLDQPYENAIANKKAIIIQLKSNVSKLQEQNERVYSLLEQGVYTTDIFLQRNKKILNEINMLQSNINCQEEELASLQNQASYNDAFLPKVQHILDTYYEIESAAVRNEALKEVLEKAVYTKNEPNRKGNRDNKNFAIRLFPKTIEF